MILSYDLGSSGSIAPMCVPLRSARKKEVAILLAEAAEDFRPAVSLSPSRERDEVSRTNRIETMK